ncbi:uncharacterized protein LOC113213737 isoform X5 [Frankliniella occidentalis]|uniref:Uncharacterized protein LOC113213737 isoform X5 n=1 Tax=Frankliniella occidentalis TaxID=133901 RepID=A0A9C6WM81_FRAOC|nr:uncharacterized protein LOC113213737 isoform X5 [Frankliniella occidentalis]XP_052121172.1 uncharacterized protein LOC113213737 isoform X5 [Frankliniella occidentalis]XP_052121173.1 uncharacterized protein LOC113213737 isoform X5 [Frankliniella occidentalis]
MAPPTPTGSRRPQKAARNSEASGTTSEEANAMDHQEQSPSFCPQLLLDLPDVPLLQVLSQLSPKDLFAAGRTCLRLAALTRTLPWRERGEIKLKSIADAMDLLRVAAPLEVVCIQKTKKKIAFQYSGRPDPKGLVVGCLDGDRRIHTTCPPRMLCMEMPTFTSEESSSLIREVAKTAKCLEVIVDGLDVIFSLLKNASWLELEHLVVLSVHLNRKQIPLWPQELVLPSLRCVSVDAADDVDNYVPYFEESLESLRSLLRPHSEQLSRVTIDSGEQKLLEHIVSALPSDLRRLEIHLLREGEAAALQQIHGLKELVLDNWETEWDEESLRQTCSELDHFLRSPGPLERLGLPGDAIPMGALGAGGLKSLQCLLLDGTYPLYELPDQDLRRWPEGFVRELPAALAGLPRLRVLILCSPPPGVFQNIAPGDVAALEVVVVVDLESCSTSPCQCRQSPVFRTRTRECARAPQMASELQSLVRRLPAPLHAIYGYQNMFFRHPVSETAGCSLCAEASTEAVAALHEYEDRPHMRLDGTVKCVRV